MAEHPDKATRLARSLCRQADIVKLQEDASTVAAILRRVTLPTPTMPDDPVERELAWQVQNLRDRADIRTLLVLGWGITS